MKLRKAIISGFKSVKDPIELLIDDKVSVLIGANDHGKSNLLQAISKLNNDRFSQDDENWDLKDSSSICIEWHFKIEHEELDGFEVSAISPDDNEDDSSKLLPTNETGELVFSRIGVDSKMRIKSAPFKILAEREGELINLRPKVELFTSPVTTNLKDDVTLSQLTTPEYEFMRGVFHLAGLWEYRDIIFTQNPRTSKLLDEASERLTKVLNDKWNQGRDLEWKLNHSGTMGDHIIIQIKDPAIDSRFSKPSLRSSGFQTFFVLSMMTNARKYDNPDAKYIFLFDEPGSYLHPYAQLDLQRSFEAVSDSAQILYTTHSLFLINKNYPQRNRVVSKTKFGTKVDQKPFQKNWKAVRDSLGILLSNNFLIADKSLLVEGPSDVIYLYDAIRRLKKDGRIDLDLNDFSVVDAGSSENYVAMAKLMLSEGRDVVALIDGDAAGRNIQAKLQKACQKDMKNKKLSIHCLDENKSIEDVCCNIEILKMSIKSLAEQLQEDDKNVFVDGFDLAQELEKIKILKSKSLGFVVSDTTKKWFRSEESMSKLSVALIYEDLALQEEHIPDESALNLIKKISSLMQLKSEKSADKGVFGEM